jgi:putative hemolysin
MSALLLGLSLLLVAILASGAMAIRSASRIWLRHWAEQRLRGAESVMLYLERPVRLLAAANAGAAIALGLVGIWVGIRSADNQATAMLTLVTYAILVIVVAHLLPRSIARRWPSAVIPITIPVLRVAQVVTAPIVTLGRALGGADDAAREDAEPHEAMEDLLREGELEGVGQRDEIAIISGVMEFGEKSVRDVMTPRKDVFAIAESIDPALAAAQIAESAFSRVPVYRRDPDHIVGMYHAFDVLKQQDGQIPLRTVAHAPASTPCNELLFRMLRQRLHLAVVEDAEGKMLGIATLEDLLEELVGDIRDEHDEPSAAKRA